MNDKELIKKFPSFAKRYSIKDGDYIYLVGGKLKVLRRCGHPDQKITTFKLVRSK